MSATRRILSLAALLSFPVLANAPDPKPVRTPVTQNQQPPGPAKVTARIVDVARVLISWDSVPDADTYHVGRLAPPNGWQRVATVPATVRQVADSGRNLNTPHTYRVVAVVGDLASKPTLSEPVQGLPESGAPGTANAPQRCETTNPMTLWCHQTKLWAGVGSATDYYVEVECPAGSYLLSGGHNARVVGFDVRISGPIAPPGSSVKWHVALERTPSVTIPPLQRQELSALALCRRE